VINLEFIELLLQRGADPNANDSTGETPLMYTADWAPGTAKVLIEWPATDVNIVACQSGMTIFICVRMAEERFSGTIDDPAPESLKLKRCCQPF
jgi:hypothetical protein